MTTQTVAREAIYQRFVTAWGSTSAFTFDNEQFTPPAGAAWVRLTVRHRESKQATLGQTGQRNFNRRGAAIFNIFVPQNMGVEDADTLVQSVRNSFEGVTVSPPDLYFYETVVREVGPDGAYNLINVEALFEYDERK